MKSQDSIHLFLKAKHFPPHRAAGMLRSMISMLRHVEPHGIEAHEASIALASLVEGLTSDADTLDILWDIAFTKLGAFENRIARICSCREIGRSRTERRSLFAWKLVDDWLD